MSYTNGNLPSLGTYLGTSVRVGEVFAGGEYDQTINYLVSPPAYTNNNMPYGYTNGAPGIEISPRYTYVLQPQVLSFKCVVNSANTGGSGYLPIQGDLSPGTTLVNRDGVNILYLDCARNLQITRVGTTGAPVAYIYGYDYGGVPMFEQVTFASSATQAWGKKAFFAVSNVYVSVADNAWSVGVATGGGAGAHTSLGLPFYASDFGNLNSPTWNDTVMTEGTSLPFTFVPGDTTSPATATTGDVRGTLTLVGLTPPSGTIYLVVDMYVQGSDNGNENVSLIYGVEQYTQPLMPSV